MQSVVGHKRSLLGCVDVGGSGEGVRDVCKLSRKLSRTKFVPFSILDVIREGSDRQVQRRFRRKCSSKRSSFGLDASLVTFFLER